jgi:uncharacterized protein (TIGR00730 family)
MARVPSPAHPHQRREPLPWQAPKAAEDDPDAAARLQAILAHPSYREANRDVDFLQSADNRGARLQLDYLKTESALRHHDVRDTVVVYGSTRIPEPSAAARRLDTLEQRAAEVPSDATAQARLVVARRLADKSRYYEVARDFGRLVAGARDPGTGRRLTVVTGGGPGIMEAANRGAFDAGQATIGLNIALPHEQYPNPYVTPGLCFQFHYFAMRKLHFLLRARALVAFPGGFGTFDELFETLTLVQTRKIAPVPIVLVGEAYWRRAVDLDFLVEEGTIDAEDRELFWYAETAQEIWDDITHWYLQSGRSAHSPAPAAGRLEGRAQEAQPIQTNSPASAASVEGTPSRA